MTRRADLVRQGLTLGAAVAQAVLPTLLTPSFPRDEQPPDVMQPADYTFAVWLPVFVSGVVHGIDQARPSRAADPAPRATGAPLSAAFASTALWAPLVATRRHRAAQVALAGIAVFGEVARRRAAVADSQHALSAGDRVALLPAASLLSAWGAAAVAVNLTAMLAQAGVVRGRGIAVLGTASTLAAGRLAAVTVRSTPGGHHSAAARLHAATTLWALGGIIVGQRRRSPAVAVAAAVAAVDVAVTARQGSWTRR